MKKFGFECKYLSNNQTIFLSELVQVSLQCTLISVNTSVWPSWTRVILSAGYEHIPMPSPHILERIPNAFYRALGFAHQIIWHPLKKFQNLYCLLSLLTWTANSQVSWETLGAYKQNKNFHKGKQKTTTKWWKQWWKQQF